MANQQQQVVDQDGSRHGRKVGLGEVVVAEGLARAVRALVALEDDFLVLVDQRLLTGGDVPAFAAVEALLDRGRQAGDLRSDLPLECQVQALYALVQACLRASELASRVPSTVQPRNRLLARPRRNTDWRSERTARASPS
jgi:hypothetical protein